VLLWAELKNKKGDCFMCNTERNKYVFLLLMLLLSAMMFLGFGAKAESNAVLSGETGIKEEYNLGEIINIPNLKIVYKNQQYDSTALLYYPGGGVYSVNKAVLNESGLYKLEYSTLVSGKRISVIEEFYVIKPLFEVTGKKSTVKYGKINEGTENEKSGIIANIAYGEVFKYNKIINLLDNTVDKDIVNFFVLPQTPGKADVLKVMFRLTDVWNPDNYVTIEIKKYLSDADWSLRNVYLTANAKGQDKVGLEQNEQGGFVYNGVNYYKYTNSTWGTSFPFSLAAYPLISTVGTIIPSGNRFLELTMDYNSKVFYVKNQGATRIISDLDEPSIYENIWNGFTTGEVFLSVWAEDYSAASFGIMITDIDGHDLTHTSINDEDAPVIDIDFGDYTSDTLPNAVVNQKYKVFDASAYDKFDGQIKVIKRVFFNYYQTNRSQISIIDNAFTPIREGDYVIEYTTTDNSGNTSIEIVEVTAIFPDDVLSISINDKAVSGTVGKTVSVASSYNLYNNIGNTDLKITATLNRNSEIIYDIDPLTLSFQPLYAGNYTIKFAYSDYIYTKTETYIVKINVSSEPVFIEEAALPKYFIKGRKYKLPGLNALNLSGENPVEIASSVQVVEDSSSQGNVAGGIYTVGNASSTTVTYTATINNNSISKVYTIPVIDTGSSNLNIAKYFYATKGNPVLSANRDYVVYSATEDSSIDFINVVQAYSFYMSFGVNPDKRNLDSVIIYLTDSVDSSARIKIKYSYFSGTSTWVSVNDGAPSAITPSFATNNNRFSINYNNKLAEFSPVAGKTIKIAKTMYGADFSGFKSGNVFLEIELKGVKGASEINFFKLNNQSLYNMSRDSMEPELLIEKVTGNYSIGDTILLKAGYAADVLDTYLTYTFVVKSGDNFIRSDDGTLLDGTQNPYSDYSITFDKLCSLILIYNAKDSANRVAEYTYTIKCIDSTAPEIQLKDIKDKGKLNTNIEVAKATVTDNVTENIVAGITVKGPDAKMVRLTDKTFYANLAGVYTVYYSAYDQAGNMALVSYEIVVS
jgi:hypothetical protein